MRKYIPLFREASIDTEIRNLKKLGIGSKFQRGLSEFKNLVGDSFRKERGAQIDIEGIAGDATTYSGVLNGTRLYVIVSEELSEFDIDKVPLGWSRTKVSFVELKNPETIAYWYPSTKKETKREDLKKISDVYYKKLSKEFPHNVITDEPTKVLVVNGKHGSEDLGYLYYEKEADGSFKYGYLEDGFTEHSESPTIEEAYNNLVKGIKDNQHE
jgi:hypothetical protein